VKNKKTNSVLTTLLLAILLTGNVGLHIFHHHEANLNKARVSSYSETAAFSKITLEEQEADCLLCNLDTFQELEESSFTISLLPLTVPQSVFCFFVPASESVLIFSKGRSPPALLA